LQTDPSHCGACNNVCTTGYVCVSGACTVRTAAECEACEGSTGKTCAAGLRCLKASGSAEGVCTKQDGTSVCSACTSDSNCLAPMVCAQD
jgi:hypothetical protein